MWTEEQFDKYRKESAALETSTENILGDESLRSCVRSVCSNLRNNSYRFRVVLADETDFKIEDEYNMNYPPPKGGELRVFASTEPLVLTQ